jgi:NAD(P)-dependent dehydrogenase (short-subunit alcohol dehydrogenase family)
LERVWTVLLPGGEDPPEARAKVISGLPLGWRSRPLDVAKATAFLASDEAEFIAGVCLDCGCRTVHVGGFGVVL